MIYFKGLLTIFSILSLSWVALQSNLFSKESQVFIDKSSIKNSIEINQNIANLVPELDIAIHQPKHGYQVRTIVIDAGHGGKDPGCVGSVGHEKDVTLGIALKLGELIKQRYSNAIKIVYTRAKDIFIPLHERADIANKANADLFISIHCNALTNPKVKGTETYVLGLHRAKENLEVAKRENQAILLEDDYEAKYDGYNPNAPENHILMSMFQNAYIDQSIALANMIEKRFSNEEGRKSHGVKQAGFVVIRRTTMPSILIETGFMTNPEEESFLNSEYGQQSIATNILNAIVDYKSLYETSQPSIRETNQNQTVEPPLTTGDKKEKSSNGLQSKAVPSPIKLNTNYAPTAKEYAVQFAVANAKIRTDLPPYTRIQDIRIKFENNLYKYQTGQFKSIDEASKRCKTLANLGFTDAFVTRFTK